MANAQCVQEAARWGRGVSGSLAASTLVTCEPHPGASVQGQCTCHTILQPGGDLPVRHMAPLVGPQTSSAGDDSRATRTHH